MKTLIFFAAVALAATPALAQNNNTAGNGSSQNGQQFLQQVREDSNNEAQEAQMAIQRASNPAVQAYAHVLAADHLTLLGELNALESNQNNGNNGSSTGAQSNRAQSNFGNATGSQFDAAFVQHEVQQNQQSLSSWENEARQNSPVGTFARIGLLAQRQHLALGRAIEAQLSGGGRSASNSGTSD